MIVSVLLYAQNPVYNLLVTRKPLLIGLALRTMHRSTWILHRHGLSPSKSITILHISQQRAQAPKFSNKLSKLWRSSLKFGRPVSQFPPPWPCVDCHGHFLEVIGCLYFGVVSCGGPRILKTPLLSRLRCIAGAGPPIALTPHYSHLVIRLSSCVDQNLLDTSKI